MRNIRLGREEPGMGELIAPMVGATAVVEVVARVVMVAARARVVATASMSAAAVAIGAPVGVAVMRLA